MKPVTSDDCIKLDARLVRRLGSMVGLASLQPAASFPTMFSERKDLEGSYDLFANENVHPASILAAHIQKVVARCCEYEHVLVLHDTTVVSFGGDKRLGLGRLTNGGQGFFAHTSFAVSNVVHRRALGVLRAEFWTRSKKTRKNKGHSNKTVRNDPNKESRVWMNGVKGAEAALAGGACAIHVMDAGADAYDQLAELDELGFLAVTRSKHNRITIDDKDRVKLHDVVAEAETLLTREVFISTRKKSLLPRPKGAPRASRMAQLHISATPVRIQRPDTASQDAPTEVAVTAIHVIERNPPEGTDAVQWLLLTNLPVKNAEQAAHVVDIYRARWVIEEYFKALKTGCSVELRQMETVHSLINMTAFFMPIAARLLETRSLARATPNAPASEVCSEEEIDAVRRISPLPLPSKPTVHQVMLSIAKLGGHLKNNGDPGWQVLARGWLELTRFMTLKARFEAHGRSPES